jgi:aminoglycoside phosphotransferase (APT) family kinase protein
VDPIIPDAEAAAAIAEAAIGRSVLRVSRFATGSQHYVFEAVFADRPPIVVRMSRGEDKRLAMGASNLSKQLRPLGVPLPAIIAQGFEQPFPYMVLGRLPGTDLGRVMGQLSDTQLEQIAGKIVVAQSIVAATPSAGRYGYSVAPGAATRDQWSGVLDDSIARSRSRIFAAGLYDLSAVDTAERCLTALRAEADAQPAVPFLHDTTTKNVIVNDSGELSGIVDVDDLCFGDPRFVVALTLAAVTAFGGAPSYVAAWMRLGGHRDDRLFRLYVAICLLDFMSEQGQVFNGNQPASTAEERHRLSGLFEDAMHRAGV